jgi:organic radical activating enzyme
MPINKNSEVSMNNKNIEYQLFTKCNLKCSYCYNYFNQTVSTLETHIADLRKIASLADQKTCLDINGGEPFLLKELAALINSVEVDTNILTYTNGTLPFKVYEKFVNEVKKDKLYLTISIHYAELVRTNNVNDNFRTSVKYLIQNIPNLKINIVFTEDFSNEDFLNDLMALLVELKEAGLKYVNILLEDSLKESPTRALSLIRTPHFKEFFEGLRMFKYKHCMWNNVNEDVSCLHIWLRKECMSLPPTYKELCFLKLGDGFVIENNFGFQSEKIKNGKVVDIDGFIEEVRLVL